MKNKLFSTLAGSVLLGLACNVNAALISYTENFDSDPTGGAPVTSFSLQMDGTPATSFDYTFTSQGDGGDITHENLYGESNGTSINIRSFVDNLGTSETLSISHSNNEQFYFSSLFARNDAAADVSIAGYLNDVLVGLSHTVSISEFGVYNFNDLLVDEVRLVSNDFLNFNIDSFAVKLGSVNSGGSGSGTVPTPATLSLMGLGLLGLLLWGRTSSTR